MDKNDSPTQSHLISSIHDLQLDALFPIARLYADAVLKLGGQVRIHKTVKNALFIRKNQKKNWNLIYSGQVPLNSAAGAQLSNYKEQCNLFLQSFGFPATKGIAMKHDDLQHTEIWSTLPMLPVVVKPNAHTVKGKGVVTNIRTKQEFIKEVTKLFKEYPNVIVEEFIVRKKEFRILVLEGNIIGIIERIPAYVIGNGRQTIRQLITEKNITRKAQSAGPISIDQELRKNLQFQKLTLSTIPKKDETIRLKNVCNFGAGGEIKIVSTQAAHVSLCRMMRSLAEVSGLGLVGVDILADSIATEIAVKNAKIIELNPNPDIAMHGFTNKRIAQQIAKKIIQAIFK